MFIFPLMALLAGVLGGVFGIGGGMLISPLLIQVGITPEVILYYSSIYANYFSNFRISFYFVLSCFWFDGSHLKK